MCSSSRSRRQNNLPNVAGSFPLLVLKSGADIENCNTPSFSLLGVSRWSCLVMCKLLTSFATLRTQAATTGGAWISSILWNGRRLMQNIPSPGFISTGSVISFPIFLISLTFLLFLIVGFYFILPSTLSRKNHTGASCQPSSMFGSQLTREFGSTQIPVIEGMFLEGLTHMQVRMRTLLFQPCPLILLVMLTHR